MQLKLNKADAMKILRMTAPKSKLRPYCATCIQKGGSFTDWAKSAYNWVKDKVETVTNSDVYKAVAPSIEEYVLPILKEQAMKMFKEYTGTGKRGKGLNVAGGSCCSHGSGLRVAGRGRQDGGFIFTVPATIAAAIAASKAAGLGAAGAAGAAAVNKIVGNGKKKQKGGLLPLMMAMK